MSRPGIEHRDLLFPVAYTLPTELLGILAGNKDMHKVSDRFKFRPDRTNLASWPILIKFYVLHHWDGGKAA